MSRSFRGKILYFFLLITASSFSADASDNQPTSVLNGAVFSEFDIACLSHIA